MTELIPFAVFLVYFVSNFEVHLASLESKGLIMLSDGFNELQSPLLTKAADNTRKIFADLSSNSKSNSLCMFTALINLIILLLLFLQAFRQARKLKQKRFQHKSGWR